MKYQNRKQFAGFIGVLLAAAALLLPASQIQKNQTHAAVSAAEPAA